MQGIPPLLFSLHTWLRLLLLRSCLLLEALEAFDDRLIVLVTRNPLDADLVEASPTVIITHGFRTFQIGAAVETLCGRLD